MRNAFARSLCRLLMVSMLALPFNSHAGLIGPEAVAAQPGTARDRVTALLERAEVQRQLQTFGVSADAARERIAALTDAEVAQLAQRIDQLPAGADATTTILLAAILFVLLWWIWRR